MELHACSITLFRIPFLFTLCVCACVPLKCVEVRRQLSGIGSFLLSWNRPLYADCEAGALRTFTSRVVLLVLTALLRLFLYVAVWRLLYVLPREA